MRTSLLAIAISLSAGVAVYAFSQGLPVSSISGIVHDSEILSYAHTTPPTAQELHALHAAIEAGAPPPSPFVLGSWGGKVTATLTGVAFHSPPEQQVAFTVVDDPADIDEAWVYLNGALLFHATRQNGSVVDRNGKSIATLTGFVPSQGGLQVTVEWGNSQGLTGAVEGTYSL